MIFRQAVPLALSVALCSAPVQAQSTPLGEVLQEWLSAINSGDRTAILGWYDKRLGIPDAAFAVDMAEDTCGYDLVRVESQTAETMSVLLAERCFPALRRLTMEAGPADDEKLRSFVSQPFALTPETAAAATAEMTDRLAERDKFAGSLLIVHRGEPTLARSWGTLDKTGNVPISLDTPVFLGSAGKMFTAIAVLQLMEAGRVDLDAPFGKYLTDYPNAEMARVTIRQLLQHRGGTGDIGILARDEGANRERARTIDDIIALNGNRAPSFPPGTKDEYSNYGYLLLGAVVERVSGQSYYDYVAENIFEPAGMINAGFPDRDHLQGVAIGYTTFFGEEPELVSALEVLPWQGTPAGGGVASANDLLKFIEALRSGKLLSSQTLEMATTAGDTPWYGMGFFVLPGENPAWGHGGTSYGMSGGAWFYPGSETTNICTATRDMACDRVMTAWHRRVFGLTE